MARRLWDRDSYGRWHEDRHAGAGPGPPTRLALMVLLALAAFVEGSLVKSAAASRTAKVECGPRRYSPFAPAARHWPGRRGSVSGERRPGRRGGGASGPAGRLENVQKLLTERTRQGLDRVEAVAASGCRTLCCDASRPG